MICPNNGNKSFDEEDCISCDYYSQCLSHSNFNNLGDNYPVLPKEEKKSPTDSERLIINAIAQEIKDYGEERVWNNLNTIPIDKRLDYLEIFFSAKRLLEKGEY